jgi:hypothetical protein
MNANGNTERAVQPNTTSKQEHAATIRRLNDAFRRTFIGGQVVVTSGIHELGPVNVAFILQKVSSFDAFSADNDPYGEHDFGSFDGAGEKIFWKIDYYDQNREAGSEDPANPDKTCRVLTIMLAGEY